MLICWADMPSKSYLICKYITQYILLFTFFCALFILTFYTILDFLHIFKEKNNIMYGNKKNLPFLLYKNSILILTNLFELLCFLIVKQWYSSFFSCKFCVHGFSINPWNPLPFTDLLLITFRIYLLFNYSICY